MSYVNVSGVIKLPKSRVFELLTQVEKYPVLVGDLVGLRLESPGYRMQKGAEYEFSVARFGIRQLWLLRVEEFVENERLVFVQSLGLFSKWKHVIEVEEFSKDETKVSHFVEYDMPMGILGQLFDDLNVRRLVKKILENVNKTLSLR